MKELTNPFEIEQYKEELRENRLNEQKDNEDYSYYSDGNIEVCDLCKTPINSHGHCPTCDY